MSDQSNREAYDRGVVAGEIAQRLAGHDEHLSAINGSMGRVANELHELTMAVQRLADQAMARDATAVATAIALKEADEARRASSEQGWSPMARALAIIGGLAALVGIVAAAYALLR